MREYKHAIFIGRFQPFHNGHYEVLKQALEIADTVLVLVGSYKVSTNIKNPFTFEERVQMIQSVIDDRTYEYPSPDQAVTIGGELLKRVKFIPVRDHYNNDNFWITEVQHKVSEYVTENETVALVGNYKDASSYYLNLFPQWEFVPTEQSSRLSATQIRTILFKRSSKIQDFNPYRPVTTYDSLLDQSYESMIPFKINEWMIKNYFKTEKYHKHVEEYQFIEKYKEQWSNAPFPPVFMTTDCVVVCSGHVLVVERGFNPGKGQLALPGGFLKQTEALEDGALRELKEETGISIDKLILKNCIADKRIFDYPGRSLRGRTITQAFYIRLKDGALPKLRAGDDANKAIWISLNEVSSKEELFFEDHAHIINYFIRRD